jgi:hypothetical protein
MNGTATRFLRLCVSLAGLVTLGWVLTGQAAKPVRHGVPTDWSHRHLIFSRPGSPERAAQVSKDPRYWQQMDRREQRLALPASAEADIQASLNQSALSKTRPRVLSNKLHRDWSKNLGTGASVGAGNYPAKFSFATNTAFCDANPTPDYAVFSTGLPGSLTQANIAAYDNLYFGCGGATPLDYWAYNTGGQVLTSPVLSRDGTQVAFVQTVGGAGVLVTLKWKAKDGTVGAPSTPTLVASMSVCIAVPCMTLTPLKDNLALPTDDTTSSVFYDYTNDIGWVGGAAGWLHKVTGMFNGTPAEVIAGGFPVQVNGGTSAISSPVFDRISNNVFVGDAGGILYRVDATNAAVTASAQLDFGVGIVEGPIVDSSNGLVYVFASSDGSAACTAAADCAAVFQVSTSFGAGSVGSEVTVGDSTVFGTPPNPLYIGGFDSEYYSSTNATGKLYVCGNTGASPTVYRIQIAAGVLPATGVAVAQLATAAAACSPVTDIPNPNLPGGFSERMFVSVQNNASSSGCGGGGCALNFISAPWINFNNYAVGQQVLSTRGHVETVIQAGLSAALPTSEPTWPAQVAVKSFDGNVATQVIWIDQGSFNAAFDTWQASHHYVAFKPKILDPAGNVQVLTTNGAGLLTGLAPPAWNTVPGGTTPDNQVTWTNVGQLGTAALGAAGGTSGIIVDNTVGSGTVVGGSQIYFSTLSDGACGGGCAVQASQPGLN